MSAGTIDALLADYRAAYDGFGAVHAETIADEERPEYQAVMRRHQETWRALCAARPTALGDLARQLRWLLEKNQRDLYESVIGEILENLADRLEAMSPRVLSHRLELPEKGPSVVYFDVSNPGWHEPGLYVINPDGCLIVDRIDQTRTARGELRKQVICAGMTITAADRDIVFPVVRVREPRAAPAKAACPIPDGAGPISSTF